MSFLFVKMTCFPVYTHMSIMIYPLELEKKEFCSSYLYAFFKCSAKIFTHKISALCASSPAFIHSVSQCWRDLYKSVGTDYTEKSAHCFLISLVSNYLNILLRSELPHSHSKNVVWRYQYQFLEFSRCFLPTHK